MSPELYRTDNEASSSSDAPISYSMLDQSLWTRFQQAESTDDFLESWFALLMRQQPAGSQGVLLVGDAPDIGPFAPVSAWPARQPPSQAMLDAGEQALGRRSGVVVGEGDDGRILAWPLVVFEQLFGAVAVAVGDSAAPTAELFRRLQWGAAWVELLLRREQETQDGELRERVSAAFDMLATVLEHPDFDDACNALVTDLARRLDCETVSIGFLHRGGMRVKAVSSASTFGRRTDLIRDIALAMDEAADQRAVVLWPAPEDWEFRVTRAHDELARSHGVGAVLTIPLQARDAFVGALCFERPRGDGFTAADVEMCDAVACVAGPVLDEKRSNDRLLPVKIAQSAGRFLRQLFGPSHFGAKMATLALAGLIAFFSYAKTDYVVSSPARLEGTVQRSVVAPFNGYLAAQKVRAGDLVEEEEIVAVLDEKDLSLERLRLVTERQQRTSELDRAIADRDRAQANIIRAQLDQNDAQLSLVDEQLARTLIRAPFAGYVVEGDLSQRVGASIERGETLFMVAPLASFRVVLEIGERDIPDVTPGQEGTLRVSAFPEAPLGYRVVRVTPLAQQADGRNFFRVEAELLGGSDKLRPGMEGVARTEIGERLLIASLTDDLVDWMRLALWKWAP
ncbi:efflux RND transporter periplasmic adaptor subunit [Tropicimonas sp. TH_r6]|uniref:HlyD family efflux transporter periplasmic adaptor subunit n=1 Tax=Tropicimonas sp. TH_r6 TaxID=3082085 RepID=UPI002955C0C7|nr:HlyD family efflux transporter periplasmic adaptor subunit [Tropicimonas sp. TH_r6]MDV7141581.1 efflux RND transporter periplasmic adaptor subunit [Tropicimonas sp. TH_r6]